MSYPITELIPHRGQMVFIDELLHFEEPKACCTVTIREDLFFYDDQQAAIPSYIGIEYIAQSIAAYSGARSRHQQQSARIGYLLGSRRFEPTVEWFRLGQQLLIEVEEMVMDSSGLGVFDCCIRIEDKVVVRANVSVFQPEDPFAIMKEKS